MNLVIITDNLPTQINGVQRTLNATIKELKNVDIIHPGLYKNISCPFYNEIKLCYPISFNFSKYNFIHILTEGPLGLSARNYCLKNNLNFTTSFLTNFGAVINRITKLPESVPNFYLKWFHNKSSCIMATNEEVKNFIKKIGVKTNIKIWGKGIEEDIFYPRPRKNNKIPIALYVGRISKDKNIDVFLNCKFNCKKVVVGDGPYLKLLQKKYPNVTFTGYLHGDDLAIQYSNADIFVFTSTVETYGLVMLESLACGTPVAALPGMGPNQIINNEIGAINKDIDIAIEKAIKVNRNECIKYTSNFSWKKATNNFLNNLVEKY